jgi:transglutaminase-like putative cysteine protease
MLSLARHLAGVGLREGARHEWTLFDPATMRNAPVRVAVGRRELVRAKDRPLPAFRVELSFGGMQTTSWVTDTGEVVREESPMGLLTVAETQERAMAKAVPRNIQLDLLEAAAVVPQTKERIEEPRDVQRLRLRLEGADLSSADLQGAGQQVDGDTIEIVDARTLRAEPEIVDLGVYLEPEPLIESDAPEIRAEATRVLQSGGTARQRAERLTRYVNSTLEKKPTVSLPSALEVLRTRVGDCNEHTALFVALARAAGIPARINVGLVAVRNAFYYHAWPEVYLGEGRGSGLWLPVDPTFNQFPADATHVRLARGGLDKQAAILPLIGRVKMTILDLELVPGASPVLVGRP